jgi:hypothetical protein
MELTYKHTFGTTWNFVAMEYYLSILNRTYQIFVTPTTIVGAFVTSMMAAPLGLQRYWFVPSNYVNKRRLEKYEQISPESDDFKSLSPLFNFQYPRIEVRRFWYDPTIKWGMGTVAHSGKLYMELSNGRKREFILLGLQQGKEILQYLQRERNLAENSSDFSEIHATLKQAYEKPGNLEIWVKLAELFSNQGEQAQEAYCRAHIQNLMLYQSNGG